MRAMEKQEKHTDSVFEKLVLQRLIAAGYRVHPQWPVGARRIDLVVEGLTKRLAVECDGEKWHTPEQLQHDLERQSILERLGWVFIRIRGSVFFRDADTAMAPVFAKLNYLGIEPLGAVSEAAPISETPLLDRIRRKADGLRARWLAEKLDVEEPETSRVTRSNASSPDSLDSATFRPNLATAADATSAPRKTPAACQVEVGDSVRYNFVDSPQEDAFVTIVDTASNPNLGLINQGTAVAKTLLGMEAGHEREVPLPTGRRKLKVLEIHKPTRR